MEVACRISAPHTSDSEKSNGAAEAVVVVVVVAAAAAAADGGVYRGRAVASAGGTLAWKPGKKAVGGGTGIPDTSSRRMDGVDVRTSAVSSIESDGWIRRRNRQMFHRH